MSNTERNWVEEVGTPSYASIVEMVAALECDYDRLEELRGARDLFAKLDPDAEYPIKPEALTAEEAEELMELLEAAGECTSREDAEDRIQEDALSVEMRGDWYIYNTEPVDAAKPVEFRILIATGGPAVQIRGELDEHGEPDRAWLEVQDWGKPWTQYFPADPDTLLAYARCFYFGEG
jgi:hypothetical protein